jgi:hypothetical protein
MVTSPAGLGIKSDSAGKARVVIVQINYRLVLSSRGRPTGRKPKMSESIFYGSERKNWFWLSVGDLIPG